MSESGLKEQTSGPVASPATRRIAWLDAVSWVRTHAFPIVLGLCIVITVLPLWMVRHIPAVDIPQHVFLVNVLSKLGDPDLPYAAIYREKPGLTYLAFYYPTRALAALFGAETAIRIWLSLMLAGIPIGMSVLLRALGRSPWLALLACPLVFTDNFYWGFISFQSSITWTLLSIAFFTMSLEEPRESPRYRRLLVASGGSLFLVQATHGAAMILPAVALPLMLLTTPSDWGRRLRAVAALVPGVAMLFAWVFAGVESGREKGALGEPWKAHGSLFESHNFVFRPLSEKKDMFLDLLSNGFRDTAERAPLQALAVVAALVVVLWAVQRGTGRRQPWYARLRPYWLGALGASCFLFLPIEITGFMSPVDTRYAQIAALLAIPALPFPAGRLDRVFLVAASAVVVYMGVTLTSLFRAFDREAESFETVAKNLPPRARIMHLVLDWNSDVSTHPVYLHYAALAAARVQGVPSFSLAIDPSFPVGYQPGKKPPASPWEWRPAEFHWAMQGSWYDYYLVRGGGSLESLFRGEQAHVQQVSSASRWRLLRRVP